MAFVELKHCNYPGCFEEIPAHKRTSYCPKHSPGQSMEAPDPITGDSRFKGKQTVRRNKLYGYRWDKLARIFKRQHPACVQCGRIGTKKYPNCVDHIIPHRNNLELFWDQGTWQTLCKSCHGRKCVTERKDWKHVTVDGEIVSGPNPSE